MEELQLKYEKENRLEYDGKLSDFMFPRPKRFIMVLADNIARPDGLNSEVLVERGWQYPKVFPFQVEKVPPGYYQLDYADRFKKALRWVMLKEYEGQKVKMIR
jgi:hypothetical protein